MSAPVIRTDGRAIVLDLSQGATLCGEPIVDRSVAELSELITRAMQDAGTEFAFGRYAEPRDLYSHENFITDVDGESRTIHMGIDLFCSAGTAIHTPVAATVEHLANNAVELDYGPLVILRHRHTGSGSLFSLYGHLGTEVLETLSVGQQLAAGAAIATVGTPPSNGNWPPHLHFQLITDLLGLGTDFPGVAPVSRKAYWLGLSPSPAAYFSEVAAGQLEYAQCS